MINNTKWLLFGWLAVGCCFQAGADLLFYEGFNYAAGSLSGLSGGTGFSSTWNSGTVVADSLTYTDAHGAQLAVSGGAYKANTGAALRDITHTLGATTSSTNWLTYLIRPDGTPGTYGGLSFFNGGAENVFSGYVTAGSEPRYRIQRYSPASGTATSSAGQTLWAEGRTDFIVIRLALSADADSDSIHLWVNPPLQTEPNVSTAMLSLTGCNVLATRIRMGHNFAVSLDELRFGTDWHAVAPTRKPATVIKIR